MAPEKAAGLDWRAGKRGLVVRGVGGCSEYQGKGADEDARRILD